MFPREGISAVCLHQNVAVNIEIEATHWCSASVCHTHTTNQPPWQLLHIILTALLQRLHWLFRSGKRKSRDGLQLFLAHTLRCHAWCYIVSSEAKPTHFRDVGVTRIVCSKLKTSLEVAALLLQVSAGKHPAVGNIHLGPDALSYIFHLGKFFFVEEIVCSLFSYMYSK